MDSFWNEYVTWPEHIVKIVHIIFSNHFWAKFKGILRTSMVDYFVKINKDFQLLNVFAKHSILDVWQGSEYASETISLFCWKNSLKFKIFFSFAAEGVINKENLKSFIKTLFRKKPVRLKKFTFHFLETFFWVTLPVNRYKLPLDTASYFYNTWFTLLTPSPNFFKGDETLNYINPENLALQQ